MSFALRFGSITSPQQSIWGVLPRIIPQIKIRLVPNEQKDSRLSELQEELENSQDPPFMIDNGTILKAAPKKKMSYRRKRVKLYTPGNKQIQPLNNIVRCSACGAVKRSHFMCMNCFGEIRTFLKKLKRQDGLIKDIENPQSNLDPIDERIIYPGKHEKENERELRKKEWIPKREPALLYERGHLKKN